MITLEFGARKRVDVPGSWDECSPAQVQSLFRIYDGYAAGRIDELQFRMLALYLFLGIRKPTRRAMGDDAISENLAMLLPLTDFVLDAEGRIKYDSVRNPLQAFSIRGVHFVGPSDLCLDLTFGEFRNAALSLNAFFKGGAVSDLDECITHLYRPVAPRANKAGRKVWPADGETFGKEAALITRLEPWKKNLIMMWFSSCINYIQTGTLHLGGEDVDLALLFSGSGASKGPAATWNDLLIQFAKEGAIGTVDAVEETPLPTILLYMWTNYKENKRYESSVKKAQGAQ
ncbi:MAG: hypothetical protein IJ222_03385 [Bacteroidales bacterium]|nr:hypothetical protein [Bacteroidales bacterium]